MPDYVVLYRAPSSVAERFATATPEEAALGLQSWVDWAGKLGSALVYPGRPLAHPMRVSQAGAESTQSDIIGMSILRAGSMQEALGMTKDHHHLAWAESCDILVLEEMTIPELRETP